MRGRSLAVTIGKGRASGTNPGLAGRLVRESPAPGRALVRTVKQQEEEAMASIKGRKSDVSAVDDPPDELDKTHGQGGRPPHQTGESNKNTRDQQFQDEPQGGGGGSKGGGGDKKKGGGGDEE